MSHQRHQTIPLLLLLSFIPCLIILSCASPKIRYQVEKVCNESLELSEIRFYVKVKKVSALENNPADTVEINSELNQLDSQIDQKLSECARLQKKANSNMNFLDFMYSIGKEVTQNEQPNRNKNPTPVN